MILCSALFSPSRYQTSGNDFEGETGEARVWVETGPAGPIPTLGDRSQEILLKLRNATIKIVEIRALHENHAILY
jgi:hypothetical protein